MFQACTPKVLRSAFLLMLLCAGPIAATPFDGASPPPSVSEEQVPSSLPVPEPGMVASDGGRIFAFPARSDVPASLPAASGPNLVASGTGPHPRANVAALASDDRDSSLPVAWYVYEHQSIAQVIDTATTHNLRVVDCSSKTPPVRIC